MSAYPSQPESFTAYGCPTGNGAWYGTGYGRYQGYSYPGYEYTPQVSVGMAPMNPTHLSEPGYAAYTQSTRSPNVGSAAYLGAGPSDAHQASFGSSNTSFSGPSTPAAGGQPVAAPGAKPQRRHNPYASSNTSNSEPTSPAMPPALVASRMPAADAAFYSSMSSAHGSSVQSPVYAPVDVAVYGDASSHPIAFTINEQFTQARGALAAAACTPRGRHMLVGALRQQHTDKIQAIFEELAPHIATIILDVQGGHVVRTLVEFLDETQVAALTHYLTPEVVLTIATSSQNTRRVLQTLFERHRTTALQPVVDIIAIHAIALSTTQQGCIAVMRCLEHALEPQRLQVLTALTPQLAALTMDPYGNYVVQAVLQYFPRETACEVLEKAFSGHWINLSCNKFASNVMEKFIQAAPPMTRKTILDELVFATEVLTAIMQDGFGNFVLQQIIDTCTTGPEYRKLSEKVRPLLSTSPFGHKIEAKLKSKRFGPPYVNQENAAGAPGAKPGQQRAKMGRQQPHPVAPTVPSSIGCESQTTSSSATSHRSPSTASN